MIVKMVHYQCDARDIRRYDWKNDETPCDDSTGDDWTVRGATIDAREQGWHLGAAGAAICPECWNAGIRWSDLS